MTWALHGLAFKLRGRHANGSCCDVEKPSEAGMPEKLWIDLASADDIRRWSGDKEVSCPSIWDYDGDPSDKGLLDPKIFRSRQGMSAPMGFIKLAVSIPHPWFINRDPGLLVTIMKNANPTIEEPSRLGIDGWGSRNGSWFDFANVVKSENKWQCQNHSDPSEVGVLGENFENLDSAHLFLAVLPVLPTILRPLNSNSEGKVISEGKINHAYFEVMVENQRVAKWKNEGLLNDQSAINLYKSIENLFEVIVEVLDPVETLDQRFLPEFLKFAKRTHAG